MTTNDPLIELIAHAADRETLAGVVVLQSADMARMAKVVKAARAVVRFDWGDNDDDAVAATDALRRAIEGLDHGHP